VEMNLFGGDDIVIKKVFMFGHFYMTENLIDLDHVSITQYNT
jgi:hypothetical protein